MKCYFFSPLKAILLKDGAIVCGLSKNLKVLTCEEGACFSIIAPPDFAPASFIAGDRFFDNNISRYPFYDGELFIPKFVPTIKHKKELLCSTKLSNFGYEFIVNAHIDGFLKLSVQGWRESAEVFLSVKPTSLTAEKRGEFLIVCAHGELENVSVFSTNPLVCLLNTVCQSYEIGETLSVTKYSRGAMLYRKREHYSLKRELSYLGADVAFDKKITAIGEPLLKSAAFFELLSLKGDITPFLSPTLKEKAKAIEEFAGDFEYAIPPFSSEYPETFALVGKSIKFAKVFIENGKIADVDVSETALS